MMSKTITAIGALTLCTGLAAAQDWTFVSTEGDPDNITAFSLSDPSGTQAVIGQTAGNFNRGFDWASQNTAYYHISTDVLNNPGDAGIYVYDATTNSSMQLAAFGFNDVGAGGGSFMGGAYWYTINDGTGADGLYRYDVGAGTTTFIGDTGLTGIEGLAADASGTIYAADNSSDSLYTLDAATGAASLVGAFTFDVGGVGGIDFAPDGTLLYSTSSGDLYELDATDASVLVSYGDIGPNISALSYRVPAPGAAALLGLGGLVATRRRR